MNKIKEEFFQHFVKKFDLKIFEQNETKSSFSTQSEISDREIEETFKDFFTEKKFFVKKIKEIGTGGFILKNETNRVVVSVSNFSNGEPNLIYISFMQ